MSLKTQTKEIKFDGKLITSVDPSLIGENYQSLKNLRYTGGNLRGVGGMTKINSTALSTYLKVRNSYQFIKDQPAEDHLLVQAYNTGLTASQVLQHTGAVPATGDFSATALWTDSAGAGAGRFSKAPNGHVAYCNGVDSCIWGGNESPVGAFICYDPDGEFEYDFTTRVQNTLTDAANSATVHNSQGGLDANTSLYLQFENDVVDSHDTTTPHAHTVTNNNVTFSTSYETFGSYCAVFNGTNAYLTVPDHAEFDFSGVGACIDGRFRFTSLAAVNPIYYQQTDASNYVSLYVTASGSVTLSVYAAGVSTVSVATATGVIAVDTDYHIELDKNGDIYYIFVNGILVKQATDSGGIADYTGVVQIGFNGAQYLAAYVDEFRVSKTYRNTQSFSVPSTEYTAGSSMAYFYLASTLPVKGFKVYIGTANTASGVMYPYYWNGSAWVGVSSRVDGTSSGGVTCAQTGSVTFSSTESLAKVKAYGGYVLYFYKIYLTNIDSSTTITHVTVDAPFQSVKDIWGGVDEQCLAFLKKKDGKLSDLTINVMTQDYYDLNSTTFAVIDSLDTNDYLLCGFQNRQLGLWVGMVEAKVNTNSANCVIYYWNGSAWVSVGVLDDKTTDDDCTFGKSGVITWNPPDESLEFQQVVNKETPLYYYKIMFTATLDSDDVLIDYIAGMPAPKSINGYKFPLFSKNRLMLCCNMDEAKNSMLVAAEGQPDVYNGKDSIKIFFGDDTELTAGCEVFSQVGSNYYNMPIIFKDREMWALTGEGPEDWDPKLIHPAVGCPAFKTLTVINAPFELVPGLGRNLMIWQSSTGIFVSDTRAPIPVHGDIANYFDKNKSECIKASMIGDSVGFWDADKFEWHWRFASGSSATTLNKELILSFAGGKLRWFEIDRGTGKDIQHGMAVKDQYGNGYAYGFLDTGYMERLEYGTTFDGVDIAHELWTGDMALLGSVYRNTQFRQFNLVQVAKTTTDQNVAISHYGDSSTTATTGTPFNMSPLSSGKRVATTSKKFEEGLYVFHSLKLSISTNNETCGFEPLYGIIEFSDRGEDK